MRATGSLAAAMVAGAALVAGASGCFVARAWNAVFAGSADPRPVPVLSSSPAAAAEFDVIRDSWRSPDRILVGALRKEVEAFLVHWPNDGLAPLAHVYLALLALQQGDFPTADREIALELSLPNGSTRDLWSVACARRDRLRGDPESALAQLRPLVGKSVDPIARAIFEQELTLAALDTHRDYEAISYMDAWLRASSDEDLDQNVKAVTALVAKLPKDVLVASLDAMRTQRASFGYGPDIERILAKRLVQIATTSGDAELARVLLDSDAGAIVVSGEAGAELGELATSKRGLNVVDGRTLGILLPTESPALRDESADVLRGVMWSLGLPRGVRDVASVAGGGVPARAPCAAAESAPPLEEPGPRESLRMVTRDDAGSADRTEVALDELAGEGAAVILAGLDPQTSTRALRWGQAHGVAVVALVSPDAPPPATDFTFVLGEARAAVIDVLARSAPALASGAVAPVVDASEVAVYPAQGGRMGPLTLLPPVSCDIPSTRAGDPRFPLSQWDHDKAHAWLVSGSTGCASDLVGELSTARARGIVGLTLEAAALPSHAAGLRVVSASAGVIPEAIVGDVRDDEVRRFSSALGTVGWWTALGRDAATLARMAIRELPTDAVSDAATVAQRRAQARDRLAAAHAPLWTTEGTGWADGHVVHRTVCTVDAPAK